MKDLCVECGKREPIGSGLCLRCICKATEGKQVKSDAARALQAWWEEDGKKWQYEYDTGWKI